MKKTKMKLDVFPLDDIARMLRAGPPSIAWLDDLLCNAGLNADFLALVREYIPTHEEEIMQQTVEDKIGLFFGYFEDDYFELDDSFIQYAYENGEPLMPVFLNNIPAYPRGVTEEAYHDFTDYYNEGRIMMLSLISSPYSPPENFTCHGLVPRSFGGERVPLIDWVKTHIGADAAKLIPPKGWEPGEIKRMTKGSDEFAALADFANEVHHRTGNWFLDDEEQNGDYKGWSRANVDELTEAAAEAEEINLRVKTLSDYLEKGERTPRIAFLKLLQHLLASDKKAKKPTGTLMEIFNKEFGTEFKVENNGKEKQSLNGRLREATKADIEALTKF